MSDGDGGPDASQAGAKTGRSGSDREPPVSGPGEAVVWGVLAALTFLVLHQAYLLAGGRFLGFGPVAAVTVAVGGVVAGVGTLIAGRASENEQR